MAHSLAQSEQAKTDAEVSDQKHHNRLETPAVAEYDLPDDHARRRGDRVADCAGLENQCARKRTQGSNPCLSAFFKVLGITMCSQALCEEHTDLSQREGQPMGQIRRFSPFSPARGRHLISMIVWNNCIIDRLSAARTARVSLRSEKVDLLQFELAVVLA